MRCAPVLLLYSRPGAFIRITMVRTAFRNMKFQCQSRRLGRLFPQSTVLIRLALRSIAFNNFTKPPGALRVLLQAAHNSHARPCGTNPQRVKTPSVAFTFSLGGEARTYAVEANRLRMCQMPQTTTKWPRGCCPSLNGILSSRSRFRHLAC